MREREREKNDVCEYDFRYIELRGAAATAAADDSCQQ